MENISCPGCKQWLGVLVNMPKKGIEMKCECGHAWYIGLPKKRKKKAQKEGPKSPNGLRRSGKRRRVKKTAS